MINNTIYQQERNDLFTSFLNRYYFENMKNFNSRKQFELFITSQCSGNCEYCYLIKHQEDLYPSNLLDKNQILNNLKLFCDWYKENKFKTSIEIFSGEIIKNGFWFDIFDVLYDAFNDEKLIYKPALIRLAENGDFLEDEVLIQKVQRYIDKFKDININIIFSLSIDGKYMDEINRKRKRDDDYYKRAFDFCTKNFYAFHPMVAANNIEHWIENFDWWKSQKNSKAVIDEIMMLEVRNNDWTKEKIQSYIEFLDHVIDYEFKKVDYNKDIFVKRIFKLDSYPGKGYRNYSLHLLNNIYDNIDKAAASCSINHSLCVRLGDLAIVPCHRTSYKDFISGYFKVKDNKIIGFECKNLEILQAINTWGRFIGPKCQTCFNKYYCPGPCFGSNYENTNDLFITPDSVCNLLKSKTLFMLVKFDSLGLFPYIEKYLSKENYDTIKYTYNKLKEGLGDYGLLLQNGIDNAYESGQTSDDIKLCD